MSKQRLDQLLVELGLAETRTRAQALVRAGQVLVDDVPSDKPGTRVRTDAAVRLRGRGHRFVSRGGLKLDAALAGFGVDVGGLVCADLGASTGGFTDCLLQRGAARVHAIDVGYGQLAWKLRQDERVVVMERTNARHLEALAEPVDLVVGDLSFISLSLLLPAMQRICRPGACAVLLIKPQFEVGPEGLKKGGRVRDETLRRGAIERVLADARDAGWTVLASMPSPVPGAKSGNVEQLVHLRLPEPA